ncbi:MAG TPA: hypothetical protein DDZ66_14835 [Firmicutes bacterium]|nr:hypothetical protein [Bacillota bacterium]
MLKRILCPVILMFALVLSLCVQAYAADFEAIEELIHTKEVSKIQEAIDRLETHLEGKPEDGDALWLIAKAYLYLGDRLDDHKEETFETGKAYAESAVEFLPTSPHPYFWQASLTGRIGQTRGILSSLFMVRPMKDALDQALELDEDYADAHWALSQLYHQAPGFPLSIGNKKLALQHAERAVELDPKNLDYQIQLAVALEYNGRKGEAILILEDLLANPALRQEPELKTQVAEHYADFTK